MPNIDPDPRVASGSLVICGTCFAIRGPVPNRDDDAEQLCDCTPLEVRRGQPVWGGDYNTYAETCRCCGLVLLRSGTRFSVWVCSTCKPLVLALNRACGHYVIPIGRHSIMNHVGAPIAGLQNREAIERFVADLHGLFGRIGGLEAYTRTVVARNRAALGFRKGKDVYLGEYLSRARRSDLTPQDAFAILVVTTFSQRAEVS